MQRLENAYGRLLEVLALAGCVLIFGMTLMICADVFLRNVRIVPGMVGLEWANEISEAMLYLVTVLTAPWLMRQGQHIRVDILLRVLPRTMAWACEWMSDVLGFACCLYFVVYGTRVAAESYASGALSIKTLVTPEWWLLAPLPIAFALVAVEFLFRMHRLALSERGPRDDAVSTG
jgi:TRAP-type transport system small permease protein